MKLLEFLRKKSIAKPRQEQVREAAKSEQSFNVVAEGVGYDNWRNFHFKILELKVPRDIAFLNEKYERYVLYGRTKDFQTIHEINDIGDLEISVDSSAFCEGIVLPYMGGIANVSFGPMRTICMKDGRIFLNERILKDRDYLDILLKVVRTAGVIFSNTKFDDLYMGYIQAKRATKS